MTMDDLFDDEEYKPKKEIRQVALTEIQRDWQNRVIYFQREYEQALDQLNKFHDDMRNPRYDLRGWFDPNQRLYFYEKLIQETDVNPTNLQITIEQMLGMREED